MDPPRSPRSMRLGSVPAISTTGLMVSPRTKIYLTPRAVPHAAPEKVEGMTTESPRFMPQTSTGSRSPSPEETGNSCQVVLTLSGRDLKDADLDSYSDPYCVVSISTQGQHGRKWKELGRTEVITNCLHPEWSTKIQATYYFEQQQRLLLEVYDKGPTHQRSARLGSATMLLHEVISAKYSRLTTKLHEEGKHYGYITVSAEELSAGRQESVYFICSATKLDRKDFLGKCDPFLKISRINYDGTLQLAHRTRYREQNLNPKWKPFEIHINQLCYGDKRREFLIECFDYDQDGNHDLVGRAKTTVARLLAGMDKTLPLVNEKKAAKNKRYVDSGQLHFHKVYCWMDYNFLDFINGGLELDFTVAVDFTKSNLPAEDESSLHRIGDMNLNQYEIAISSIAEICQHYNRKKVFQAYGFGARLPPDFSKKFTSFPLNVETGDPVCHGIDGLLEAYHAAQSRVQMDGPNDFAPIIRMLSRQAAMLPADGKTYLVLLLITDGVISDMERTKEEIIRASSLPLSVIIVGVGYDSFEEMKVLDSDNTMLVAGGKMAKRDIVQFVQMRSFLPPHRQMSLEEAKARLASEVLQEIPQQITSYMKSHGIFPKHSPAALAVNPPGSARRDSTNSNNELRAYDSRRQSDIVRSTYDSSPRLESPRGYDPRMFESPRMESPRVRRMLPQVPTGEMQNLHMA